MTARPVCLLVRRGERHEIVKSYSYVRAARELFIADELVRRRLAALDWLWSEIDRWAGTVPDWGHYQHVARGEVNALRLRLLAERDTLASEHARLDLEPDTSPVQLTPRRAARNARRFGPVGVFDVEDVDGEPRALPTFRIECH